MKNAINNLAEIAKYQDTSSNFGGFQNPVTSDWITKNDTNNITANTIVYVPDSMYIDNVIQKHWFEIGYQLSPKHEYTGNGKYKHIPPYHMIYAYLIENTRIAQIFAKLLTLYFHDEVLGKTAEPDVVKWLTNTENLFFKTIRDDRYRKIQGALRPDGEAMRRNAYYRMFGMELGFGNMNNEKPQDLYYKPQFYNKSFISLFESFLSEFWQAYTNVTNSNSANTTDYVHIIDTVKELRRTLMSRRTNNLQEENVFENYMYFNLSREEYSSTILLAWLHYIISDNSPVVKWLGCEANNPGERLKNIGSKVGIKAHSKSSFIFEIAEPMADLLRKIEAGDFKDEDFIQIITGKKTVDKTKEKNDKSTKQEELKQKSLEIILLETKINTLKQFSSFDIDKIEQLIGFTLQKDGTKINKENFKKEFESNLGTLSSELEGLKGKESALIEEIKSITSADDLKKNILQIINYWEEITGHKIKHPETQTVGKTKVFTN